MSMFIRFFINLLIYSTKATHARLFFSLKNLLCFLILLIRLRRACSILLGTPRKRLLKNGRFSY